MTPEEQTSMEEDKKPIIVVGCGNNKAKELAAALALMDSPPIIEPYTYTITGHNKPEELEWIDPSINTGERVVNHKTTKKNRKKNKAARKSRSKNK